MKKINQHKFVKLARGMLTREEIDLTIQFMRNYLGFISYYHLILFTMYPFKDKKYKDILEELEWYAHLCDKFELNLSY